MSLKSTFKNLFFSNKSVVDKEALAVEEERLARIRQEKERKQQEREEEQNRAIQRFRNFRTDKTIKQKLLEQVENFPPDLVDLSRLLPEALNLRDQGFDFYAQHKPEYEVTETFYAENPNTREYNDGYTEISWEETYIQEARIVILRGEQFLLSE